MFRKFTAYLVWLAIGYCLASSVVQNLLPMTCSSESNAGCTVSQQYRPMSCESSNTCSPFGGCEKSGDESGKAHGGGGCCVCSPNCCVYLVPEFRYELVIFLSEKMKKNRFLEPSFAPQSSEDSVWRPPARVV